MKVFARWLLFGAASAALSQLPAEVVRYSYDNAGRLIRVQYGDARIITYQYDPSGNLLRRTLSGGEPVTETAQSKERE